MRKDSGQALVIVLFIIIIFTLVVVTIASLTTREVELREIDEMAVKAGYVAESGEERARYVLKGSALKFDGTDDYVNIPTFNFSSTSVFTIEAWVKVGTNLNRIICGQGDDTTSTNEFGARLMVTSAGNANFAVDRYAGSWYAIDGKNISDNSWHHLVGIYNNTQMSFYVDGVLQGTNTYTESAVAGDQFFAIGSWSRDNTPSALYFNGVIDEVRVYNRALYSTEVADHYNGKYTNESGLVLLQHFEEGPNNCNISASPATACLNDDSENGNNGTPNGFTSNTYDAPGTPDSGWTRNYPYKRSVFIGDIKQSGITLSSCPDSKFTTSEHSCGDKNVIGDYYYNVTITRFGDQRPEGKGICTQLVCIDSGGQNVE